MDDGPWLSLGACFQGAARDVNKRSAAECSTGRERCCRPLGHTRSCPSLTPGDGPCTCALDERIALQTEQTMSAAWRKRAEEAEAELVRLKSGS